jgi:hypothetical protein
MSMMAASDCDFRAYFHPTRAAGNGTPQPIARSEAYDRLYDVASDRGCTICAFSWMRGVNCAQVDLLNASGEIYVLQLVCDDMVAGTSPVPALASWVPAPPDNPWVNQRIDLDGRTFGDLIQGFTRLVKTDFAVATRH